MATTITKIPTDHFDFVVDDVISGGGDGIEKSDSKPEIESELKTKSDELEIDQMKKLVDMFKKLILKLKNFSLLTRRITINLSTISWSLKNHLVQKMTTRKMPLTGW
ncbi:unnamed protein product [Arabis nemorensis]|uniref:Uncharacterized protein n=1 Tax=Arabis nemorensis TaxID=586526 RepID=A0A565CDV9_9BRAS|nr:unnamed protein product [Arabis nemorensis]